MRTLSILISFGISYLQTGWGIFYHLFLCFWMYLALFTILLLIFEIMTLFLLCDNVRAVLSLPTSITFMDDWTFLQIRGWLQVYTSPNSLQFWEEEKDGGIWEILCDFISFWSHILGGILLQVIWGVIINLIILDTITQSSL